MTATAELRREKRVVCHGPVRLRAQGQEFTAQLADVSAGGFRAAVGNLELAPGTVVEFQHMFFVGRAQVMWTSEMAGQLYSGFQVMFS